MLIIAVQSNSCAPCQCVPSLGNPCDYIGSVHILTKLDSSPRTIERLPLFTPMTFPLKLFSDMHAATGM